MTKSIPCRNLIIQGAYDLTNITYIGLWPSQQVIMHLVWYTVYYNNAIYQWECLECISFKISIYFQYEKMIYVIVHSLLNFIQWNMINIANCLQPLFIFFYFSRSYLLFSLNSTYYLKQHQLNKKYTVHF